MKSLMDMTNVTYDDLLYFSVASGGAMGTPGTIVFYDNTGTMFHYGFLENRHVREVFTRFPELEEVLNTRTDAELNKLGWQFQDLGMGNGLFLRLSEYPLMKWFADRADTPAELYRLWPEIADMNRTKETTLFWKIHEENGVFSNWFPAKFVIDDFEYSNVEQYLMAQKAKLFHDSKRYTAILKTSDPEECKKLGKMVTPYDDKEWEMARYDIAFRGNMAKYSQNPELKERLLATGHSLLAEASPFDNIWGIGMSADKAKAVPADKWKGMNLLGLILMMIRRDLR